MAALSVEVSGVVEGRGDEPSDRDRFYQFISFLYNAFDSAAWDLPAHAPLDEETVKAYMEAAIREATLREGLSEAQEVIDYFFEQYAGCLSHATAA